MQNKVFITCAVTGAGDTVSRSPRVPITPRQIAKSAIDAAKAGAAVVHLHVRNPQTGQGSRDPKLFAEAVNIFRDADVGAVLNLTAGMGGDLVLNSGESPLPPNAEQTDMAGPLTRLQHVEALRPEICTLDCGSMNFAAGGDYVMVNAPSALHTMAKQVQALGVRPELEVFDTGHLVFVHDLIKQGVLDEPYLLQLCMGIPYGAPAKLDTLMSMVHALPAGCVWSSFAIGRLQLPWLAATVLAGGNVRVGLEDNLYLARGQLATNAQLVERAVDILHGIGVEIMTANEVRDLLKLKQHV